MKTKPTAILAAMTLALALAGCAGGATTTDRQAAADRIAVSYAALKSAVVLYAALPACGAQAAGLCSDPAIVAQVTKALAVADVAVAEAKTQILAASDQSTVGKWTGYATSAIAVLAKTLETYGVKASP